MAGHTRATRAQAEWREQNQLERQAAQEAKRAAKIANREEWRRNRANSNRITEETIDAVVPLPAPQPLDTSSLGKLRGIMGSIELPLYQRMDAAEVVLGYDLAPASLVDMPAEQVAVASFRFLRAVADDSRTPDRLKFRALKCLAAIENSRAAARQSGGQLVAKRELQRQLGRETEWTGGMWPWPPANIAERFTRARRRG